jgi:dTMP kinase
MGCKSLIKLVDMKDHAGKLITFEGPEGSGKSSHIELLLQYLEGKGKEVEVLREPGTTAAGEKIRKILLDTSSDNVSDICELYLYLAARAQLIEEKIIPFLKEGKIVICDRFNDATWAYQIYASDLPEFIIDNFLNYMKTKNIEPDLTILLDIKAEAGLKRAAQAHAADRVEKKGIGFHNRVRQGYLILAKRYPERIKLIQSVGPIEAVQDVIRKKIDEIL